MNIRRFPRALALLSAGPLALGLTACSSGSPSNSDTAADSISIDPLVSDGETLEIATSFYPIMWLAEQIGGEKVTVISVTPTTVEPHDYELSPKEIATLDSMDLLFYVEDFQPSLDDAATTLTRTVAVDLTPAVDLVVHDGLEGHSHTVKNEDGTTSVHTHEVEDGAVDPHFWLDPQRMKAAAERMTDYMVAADPANAEYFEANRDELIKELDQIDAAYSDGLKTCESRAVVTTHTSFGYLADRYDLEQVALSGLDPESEPSPAVVAEIKKYIQDNNISTIFTESLLSTKTADAIAKETGISTATLDPMESVPASGDYARGMKENLSALSTALKCS